MEKPATNKLTPKQEQFCREYLVDLNATQAAIRAGYSKKTAEQQGARLLRNVKVQMCLQSLRLEQQERVQVTADYVLTTIVETMERCKQAVPVRDRKGDLVLVTGDDGELHPVYEFDSGAVLKGAELLGKHLAMWTDRQRIEDPDGNALPVLKLVVQKGGDGEQA